jgi:Arc/MetJ family transcription regulator
MATNLAIDDRLLNKALRVGGHKTKKDTVTEALEEYVRRHEQLRILDLFGKVDFDPKYDHKRQRRRP